METWQFKTTILLTLLFVGAAVSKAQSLDDYVQEGLNSNLVLHQKNISLEQAQQSLQVAKSYFLPNISLLADYTSGKGGRSIAIPVGDLLNPVYNSLNQMTQSDDFPQIENVEQNFFPRDFYDARIRTSIPLINTDLHINRDIQGQKVVLQQYEVEVFKRELIENIKTAYYNVKAGEAGVKIYESALTLVQKNVDINRSLVANGKSLPANLLRSKSEAEQVKADLNSARNKLNNARNYFNFLLNKDLDLPINTNTSENLAEVMDTLETINQREEIQMLQTVREINESSLRMSKFNRLPKVNAFLDLGTQSEGWRYNNDSRYYLVGVQLSLPIFQGFRNDRTIRQNKLELQKTEHDLVHTQNQLEFAVSVARNELATTIENYHAAEEQLKSAQSYFQLIDRGYKEGINSLIEFLDARNELTSSHLQLNLRKLEVLTASARLERETASYTISN
jgi:outer membrane protein